MSTRSEVISLAGYHGWECGMKDVYEIILNNTTDISGGRVNSGDTNDYSRLALRVRGSGLISMRSCVSSGNHSLLHVVAQKSTR